VIKKLNAHPHPLFLRVPHSVDIVNKTEYTLHCPIVIYLPLVVLMMDNNPSDVSLSNEWHSRSYVL